MVDSEMTWVAAVTFTYNLNKRNHSETTGMYGAARMRRMLASDNDLLTARKTSRALPDQTTSKGTTMPSTIPPAPPGRSRPHPMLIAAAIAVILFCLVATAAVMGWIPSTLGGGARNTLSDADRLALSGKMAQQDNAAAMVTPAPAPPPARVAPAPTAQNFVPAAAPEPSADASPPAPARDWCANCGNIESIRTITTRAEGSGLGAGAGAVLGGLLGNQVGSGHGRQLATVAGAVGGAVAGNQIEGSMKANTSYEIRVRLDNGKYRTFHQTRAPGWRDGERVRIVNGGLRSVS
jgi:outer membrane lipoprotein SlyB